jgi:UDP-N-acetylmuramoyl-L-alanyl-D-glutamate--2,6-diaminopimelate ligase
LEIVDIKESINKTDIILKYKNELYNVESALLGEFNVYNLCAAILALLVLNYEIKDIIVRIKNIKIPQGRMEFLNFGQKYSIILDYAHTPDAFENVYKTLNKLKTGRIITVTGSAGGREHEKRPLMGKIVLENSNYVIFTMDDPRNEDVNTIIDELTSTSNKDNYERIIDRKTAIHKALSMARKDDIILIAGKGDDHYMAINDEYVPYSDLDVIKEYFN